MAEGGQDRVPNPLSPGVAGPEGFLPGARPPHRRAGGPADRAGDRYGAWVSELGPVAQAIAIRPATMEDAGEVVRLAALMYEAMGLDATGTVWRRAAVTAMAGRLGEDAMVFVADDPGTPGRLAATGAGVIATRLPGPANPAATVGYIQWVSTDPRWRRRGLARLITSTLITWFRDRDVRAIELHATPEGAGLYRSLGFGPGDNPGLRIRL